MAFEWAKVGARCVCLKQGQWVLTDGREAQDDFTAPVFGGVYTIRTAELSGDKVFLRFEEIRNPIRLYSNGRSERRFLAERFRPFVTKTLEQDMEAFNYLLNPTPLERLDRLMEILGNE